jgi:hypothetical protein
VSPQTDDTSPTHSESHFVVQQYESPEQIWSVHELQVAWSADPVEQIACAHVPLISFTASAGASAATIIDASIGRLLSRWLVALSADAAASSRALSCGAAASAQPPTNSAITKGRKIMRASNRRPS